MENVANEVAVLDWFRNKIKFNKEVFLYNITLKVIWKAKDWNLVEMALGLYDCARKEKWRIDTVTFFIVIRVYGVSGNFDGALNVYEEMKAHRVKPNMLIYNTLLDAMGRTGRPWQVKTIFTEMESNELVPNRITYVALLRAYSSAWYAEDALRVYKEMKEKRV